MGAIISYVAARSRGLKLYFTGKPCKRGHVAGRWVSNCRCKQCAYDQTNRWGKTRRGKKIKDKFRRRFAKNNPDYFNDWRRANPDAIRIAKRKWYLKDPSKRVMAALRWVIKNREKARAAVRNRTARRKLAKGRHTAEQVLAMLYAQKWICVGCGKSIKKKRHIDHIMPLTLGGSNYIRNLQGLCPSCNCSKNAKHPKAWMREISQQI